VHQPWLASRHPGGQNHPIVIVGTGPVGLTTALEIARHGQRCVVLESELQVSEGSRAIVFTRRSMEILQQVGVAPTLTVGTMGKPKPSCAIPHLVPTTSRYAIGATVWAEPTLV
jgi:monoamine oxidase